MMERNERLKAADKYASRYTDKNEARIARGSFMLGCEFEAQGEAIKGVNLESEKPMQEELEKEVKSFTKELECGAANIYRSMFGEEGNFDKFSWEDIIAIIKDTARHFAQWGAEHLKK